MKDIELNEDVLSIIDLNNLSYADLSDLTPENITFESNIISQNYEI